MDAENHCGIRHTNARESVHWYAYLGCAGDDGEFGAIVRPIAEPLGVVAAGDVGLDEAPLDSSLLTAALAPLDAAPLPDALAPLLVFACDSCLA